jgi:hypothetical protein
MVWMILLTLLTTVFLWTHLSLRGALVIPYLFSFFDDLILFIETEGSHSDPYVAAAAHTHMWPLWGRASSEV